MPITHQSTAWSREDWMSLAQHPSPLVREWVAENSRLFLRPEERTGLLDRLLQDERALVREKATRDMVAHTMPGLADRYLELAQSETSSREHSFACLQALARLDSRRLLAWMERAYARAMQNKALLTWTLQDLDS